MKKTIKTLITALTTAVAITLAVTLAAGCSGPYAVTGIGSSEGDAAVAVGKVIDSKTEVGINVVANNVADGHETYAVGPYAAYLVPVPEAIQDEWQPIAGGRLNIVIEADDYGLVPGWFVGVIKDPNDTVSLVALAEQSFPSGNINTPDVSDKGDDVYGWVGIRYRF